MESLENDLPIVPQVGEPRFELPVVDEGHLQDVEGKLGIFPAPVQAQPLQNPAGPGWQRSLLQPFEPIGHWLFKRRTEEGSLIRLRRFLVVDGLRRISPYCFSTFSSIL